MEIKRSKMKTGHDIHDTTLSDRITETGTEMLNKLLEHAIVNASIYAKSAGRDNMSGKDIIIALQYEAHEFLNRNLMSNENEYESEDESDSESVGETDDDDPTADAFTFSYSNDPLIQRMNYYHETWDSWIPTLPIENALKNAVDQAISKYK